MYYYGDWADYRQMYQMPGGYGPMPGGYGGYPPMAPGQVGPAPGGATPAVPSQWGGQPGGQLAQQVLSQVRPLVQYAAYEQQVEGGSPSHTILEVAAIAYLMGRGLPFRQARRLVESWEVNEKFPGFERNKE